MIQLKDETFILSNSFLEMTNSIGSSFNSFANTFSSGLAAVITQGASFSKQMKHIWRDLANDIIS